VGRNLVWAIQTNSCTELKEVGYLENVSGNSIPFFDPRGNPRKRPVRRTDYA